jgi:hypothetical protein
MFKLYWWLISIGVGMSILWITAFGFSGLIVAWFVSTNVYLADPESTLTGKFDGGYINE